MVIFTMLILPVREHERSCWLLVYSSVSLSIILTLPLLKSFTSLVS